MPLVATRGAASAQGFGEFAQQTAANYIEDVFSTWLYTGTSSTQNIVNGIDLAGKGGLVWTKGRNLTSNNNLYDTVRGANNSVSSNLTSAQFVRSNDVIAFNSNGFTAGGYYSGYNAVSWTFREQPKFFDVVTYTGNGSTQAISHSLGSVPGCIIIKSTNSGSNWIVYHRSLGEDYFLQLNLTDSRQYSTTVFDITAPTSTAFTVGSNSAVNSNGDTYVAYLFAHNAGGFGLTGTDNVISCGSFTVSGNAATVNLGYEPQWLLIKSANSVSAWDLFDSMRGLQVSGNQPVLNANNSGAEFGTGSGVGVNVTSTGFATNGYLGNGDHIYIAIRRGPMKTPTTGTSVFEPVTTAAASAPFVRTNWPIDMAIRKYRPSTSANNVIDRMRGWAASTGYVLDTASTAAETTSFSSVWELDYSIGMAAAASTDTVYECFRRAPGFFDVVCYTGTGSARTVNHNLGAVPQLIFVKRRSSTNSWYTYNETIGAANALALNTTLASFSSNASWNSTSPTSTVFTVNTESAVNRSGDTYVAYLFASCPGVSKVGSYTGTGALQTINCGFTGGARFVLIKRTDSTGDWWVYDSARGISSGNDPYLFLNSTAAEVTGTNYVDTTSVGFQVTAAAPAGLNANGGTYIFLAIA
jgi:hypothetical protein